MSKLEAECAFEIGDLVTFGVMAATLTAERCPPMQVVERTVQQCYGGIQVHYLCRGFGQSAQGAMLPVDKDTFVESELIAFPMEELKELKAKAAERAAARRSEFGG
jgi:hypothetical protein